MGQAQKKCCGPERKAEQETVFGQQLAGPDLVVEAKAASTSDAAKRGAAAAREPESPPPELEVKQEAEQQRATSPKSHTRDRSILHRRSFTADGSEEEQMFRWLGWSPERGSAPAQVLAEHFPTALPDSAVFHRVITVMGQVAPGPTLYGCSTCPDEINNEEDDLVHQFRQHFGAVFPLGGISGAPFAGKTGFAAFSNHVSHEDGHVFVLFGPHIAISANGVVGKYQREGQAGESAACGAVLAAYQQCCAAGGAGGGGNNEDDPFDTQQAAIRDALRPHISRLQAAETPIVELIKQAYEFVATSIEEVVNTNFGTSESKLILLGGIQLNMPHPSQDHFVPMKFEMRQANVTTINLLPKLLSH